MKTEKKFSFKILIVNFKVDNQKIIKLNKFF